MAVKISLVLLACAAALADRYHGDGSEGGGNGGGARTVASPSPEERTAQYWAAEAHAAVRERRRRYRAGAAGRARRVLMFLGDGMSVPTLAAARALLGQRRGRPGEEASLSFEDFPAVGLAKTYCVDNQIPDSACTATAYLCGVKNNLGTLGVTAAVPRFDCQASRDTSTHLDSIAAWALEDGRDVGIVTTTRITHASPSGAYAKTANRNWENDAQVSDAGHDPAQCPDIAHQLIHGYPGNKFKVIFGGGRRNFRPTGSVDEEGKGGRRADGRDLIEEWEGDKRDRNVSHAFVWNREQLMSFDTPPEYLLGLFESNHLQYHLEADRTTEPTLAELTEIAIRSLDRNEKGFFLFVESGRIDHAHHDNYVQLALDETIALSEAAERARRLLPAEDSLLVVTADHSHVMAYNGYTRRGGDILGASGERDADGVPYMTLSYSNGPGARRQLDGVRTDVRNDDNYGELDWRSHAEMPRQSETHGGEDVAVFALGPHHQVFGGLYEQSQLPHLMAYAGCFGALAADQPHCRDAPAPAPDA